MGDCAYRRQTFDAQSARGIGIIRHPFHWSEIERTRARYSFAHYDALVADAALRQMTLLPVIFGPPSFRSSAPRHPRPGTYPPHRFADMGTFAAVLVRRYGPKGTFWTDHPDLPREPIRAWQVWNEPNLKAFWPSGPDPRQYTALLKATAAGIRRADPRAEVISAGLPNSRLGVPLLPFIRGMYKAGAGAAMDALAINAYAATAANAMTLLHRVRAQMQRHGGARDNLWVTESGWADAGPKYRFNLGPDGQARQIRLLLGDLTAQRAALRLRGVVYYAWRDAQPYSGRDFWVLHTGLLDLGGRPKPALTAFTRGAHIARAATEAHAPAETRAQRIARLFARTRGARPAPAPHWVR